MQRGRRVLFADYGVLNFWTYLVGVTVLVLIPGPNTLFVLKTSASYGIRGGYIAAAGVFIGDGVLMGLTFAGVATIIQSNPLFFTIIRWLGAGYLLWLGIKMLYSTYAKVQPSAVTELRSARRQLFKRSILLSMTNPKAILFYVSFFVQFINIHVAHPANAFLILAVVLEIVSFTYMSFLIFCGSWAKKTIGEKKWLTRVGNTLFGLVFLGFAAKLMTIQ